MSHRLIPTAVLGALLLASPAIAQQRFGGRPAPSGHSLSGRSSGMQAGRSFGYAHRQRAGVGLRRDGWGYGLGWDYFPNYYDRGEDYARPDYEPPMPPANQQAMFEPPQPEKVIQPILIERQGETWVQISGYKTASVSGQAGRLQTAEPAHSGSAASGQISQLTSQLTGQPTGEIPPAVLVFRDGHQEEITSYTIIGNVLYAKADYWSSGEWTRAIEIANLDVPATLKLNLDHGYRFRLPSNPQEVVIRP